MKLSGQMRPRKEGVRKILGMIIERNRDMHWLKVHQRPYLERLVSKYGLKDCKSVPVPLAPHFVLSKSQCPKSNSEYFKMEHVPYANTLQSLMYAMIATRPDLAYSVSLLSRYMSNPGIDHWNALKHVIAYVNCTADIGLVFQNRMSSTELVGYVDVDFTADRYSRKSTIAYYFTLGRNCISWKSQL
ncbi:unnamed protein product [Rhodiola kirilowii]